MPALFLIASGCSPAATAGAVDLRWWASLTLAFVLGAGLSGWVAWRWIGAPLRETARIAVRIESGNLNETFPTSGPPPLMTVHRLLNALLADFQEVLLLFAQLTSGSLASLASIDSSPRGAEKQSEPSHDVEQIRKNLSQMRSIVESFTFFGVEIRGDTISDANIERALKVTPPCAPGAESGTSPGSSRRDGDNE